MHPSCIARASLVRRSCVTRLPVPLSAGLLLVRRWPWPLLCLLLSRCSACLSVCWPVAFLSLVCLLARRCSSVADVSLVCLLVHHWLSLSCTCSGSPVRRSSICSCVCSCTTGPSVRRCSAVGLSAGVVVTGPWFVHRSSIYWSRRCPVTWLHLAPLGTVFASVRLFGCSTVRFYTPLVLTSFCSAARLYSPCAHSYSICWLRLAATLFTHTLFHAWCPVTLLSLTRCSRVVVLRAS